MNSSSIEIYHTGLWFGSQDIATMTIDEDAKNSCRELVNISIKEFDKFWRNKKFNFRMNFIKKNIKNATNIGISEYDDKYLIIVDGCYINKNTELFGTFYLLIDIDVFEEYELSKLFPVI